MRKRIACGIIVGIAVIGAVLFGYYEGEKEQAAIVMGQQDLAGIGNGQQTDEQKGINDEVNGTEAQTEAADDRQMVPIADLDQAYSMILDNCTKDFIGGHTVDESFLHWVYAQYGEDVLLGIAQEVASGEQDTNIWYELTGQTMHVLWLKYCQVTGMQQYELEHVYWKEAASSDKVVLDFTGDISFDENSYPIKFLDRQPNGIYDCFSADLLQEMQAADIMMINNEFTYSTRGTALKGKDYTFRANPKRVKLLEAFGTDIVNLANNHVYDYGPDALLDTLDTLKQEGVPYVGAGADLEEAEQPVYFVANGRKIAIVAATQIERSTNYTKEATEDSPGVLKTLNPDKFVAEIKEAKADSDIVIVFVHWGTEGDSQYGVDQAALAEAFVEAGADAIIGGHTHCLQGMTYMEGVPIIYSLGNFWFSKNTLDTGISQLIINQDGSLDFRFLPCIQKNMVTSLVTDTKEKSRILQYMEEISTQVSIDEDGYVSDLSESKGSR